MNSFYGILVERSPNRSISLVNIDAAQKPSAPNEKNNNPLRSLCLEQSPAGRDESPGCERINHGRVVSVVFGGKGFRWLLDKGAMSEIGIQVSYSSAFLGTQHSQRSSLKCHMISASCSRAHSFSVMVLVESPAKTGEHPNAKVNRKPMKMRWIHRMMDL